MTTNTDRFGWMPYIPKLFYRDIVGVDPHHTDALRARDLEMFTAYGMFCRRVIPREFTPEAMSRLDYDSYVVVDFGKGRWQRQLGERDGIPKPMGSTAIRPRRRSLSRRRS